MLKLQTMAFAVVGALVLSGCGPDMGTINAYCERLERCDVLLDQDDAVKVCAEAHAGAIRITLANSEKECVDLAATRQALWACRATLECDATEGCETELEAYEEAIDDAGELCNVE